MTTCLSVYSFSAKIMDTQVNFQLIKMEDSFHLWIGSTFKYGDMAMSMKNKYDTVPPSSPLLGASDSPCVNIAQRLAKKTGKQVFVSGDLAYNQIMLPLIEKRIGEELKNFPEKFFDST
ncbi:hypothetical protein FSP39_000816 [Pinctada imbricata]|uniref:Uncharacterized protein n=1 Tax=Pinctada imbricata TaxID=66713 RepID=A0AA88Y2Q3_PINIB|nr:hypothetical protein FSP39_000816 [Pinctada imbricata]